MRAVRRRRAFARIDNTGGGGYVCSMLWLTEALDRLARGQAVVLVTVAGTSGSAPRPAGTKLLVGEDSLVGSVGGGKAERQAVARARALLAGAERRRYESVADEAATDRCCGGTLELVFERLDPSDRAVLDACRGHLEGEGAFLLTPLEDARAPKQAYPLAVAPASLRATLSEAVAAKVTALPEMGLCLVERLRDRRRRIWLFGAGHVGQALARALAPLPFHLTWVDDRPELLAGQSPSMRPLHAPAPAREVGRIPPGAFVLVMTHGHGLDFEIAEAALRRGDLDFVGMIGSAAKKAQLRRRCRAHGLPEELWGRLVCPIGLPAIRGREPAVIAASVAAQLLQAAEAEAGVEAARPPAPPLLAAKH